MGHYKTITNNTLPDEIEKERDKISSVRISQVTDYLINDKPTLIPFKCEFPIVSSLDYKSFSNLIMNYNLYEDLPKFIKEKVELAEKVKYYDVSFKNYLQTNKLTEKEFSIKNPKTKLDIFYDWMFKNKMDIGILD